MKHILIVLALMITTFAYAQDAPANKFKIKKITFSMGADEDRVNKLGFGYFANQVPLSENFPYRDTEFAANDLYSGVCENPSLALEVALTHPKLKNIEWRNAINYMRNRIDAVSYHNNDYADKGTFVSFHGRHNEIGLESSLVYDLKLGAVHFYGGAGTNIGVTTNNSLCYSASDYATDTNSFRLSPSSDPLEIGAPVDGCVSTNPIVTQRLFVQGGASILFFKRVELGIELKKGIGYRTIGAGEINGTKLTGYQLRVGYRFN